MKTRESYKTKQKDIILNEIKKHNNDFTVMDIYNELNKKIGLTTIYRLMDKLVIDESVSKTIGKNNTVYYHYLEKCDCDDHFYLKCDSCGALEHVDCECIKELSNHISKKHKFVLTDNIIINGFCNKCRKVGVK